MNLKKYIYVPDEIKKVIDFLKVEKNIIDITEVGSVSTIFTNSLVLLDIRPQILIKNGQIVTINNINYHVSNVDYQLKSFEITKTGLFHMSDDLIPVKVLDATKWNLAIDYKFGSKQEIDEILINEVSNPDKKLQRFPLIWLFINEGRDHSDPDFDFNTSVKMAFVYLSNSTYVAEYRKENIFKPILEPLETLFLEAITSLYFTDIFRWDYRNIPFKDYHRYHYGSSDKNKDVLSDPTDAIELEIELTFKNQ